MCWSGSFGQMAYGWSSALKPSMTGHRLMSCFRRGCAFACPARQRRSLATRCSCADACFRQLVLSFQEAMIFPSVPNFSQIGATGFSFGAPRILKEENTPFELRLSALVQSLRDGLATRIREDLGDVPEASLAVALLVGDRSAISDRDQEDLRAAGLAHILAISGLHMALFRRRCLCRHPVLSVSRAGSQPPAAYPQDCRSFSSACRHVLSAGLGRFDCNAKIIPHDFAGLSRRPGWP